jgi:hypothetical protein
MIALAKVANGLALRPTDDSIHQSITYKHYDQMKYAKPKVKEKRRYERNVTTNKRGTSFRKA